MCGKRTEVPRRIGFPLVALCPRHREWVGEFGELSPREVGVLVSFARVFGTVYPMERR